LCEDDNEARTWVKNFRKNLDSIATKFEWENPAGKDSDALLPVFRSKVLNALNHYKETLATPQPGTGDPEAQKYFPIASRMLISGQCIPFLGPGVYGSGPLSTCELRKDLHDETCRECSPESCQKSSLATASEFHDLAPKRNLFLDELSNIINKQAINVTLPPIYDLIKQRLKPPLIVSGTLDLVLERTLWDGGNQRCLILCHAIRSKIKGQGTPNKILVFNGPEDQSPERSTPSPI
jgi:hypothetical protein